MQQEQTTDDKELLRLLDKQLQSLSSNSNVKIDDLYKHPDIQSVFATVKVAATMLYDTDSYPQFVDLLRKNKPRGALTNDTIGAYLFSCLDYQTGEINANCSPLCLGSIPIEQNSECCDKQVWTLRGGQLRKYSTKTGMTEALLYVPSDFTSLTKLQYQTLKKSGVTNVILVYSTNDENIDYRVDTKRKSLNEIYSSSQNMGSAQSTQLPSGATLAYVEGNQPINGIAATNPNTGTTVIAPGVTTGVGQPSAVIYRPPQSNWTWLWVIIGILIVVGLIWLLTRNKNKSTTLVL